MDLIPYLDIIVLKLIGKITYIDQKLLHSEYEDSGAHLKEMLMSALNTMDYYANEEVLDMYRALDTLKCINDYCSLHGIDGVNTSNLDLLNSPHILERLRNYYAENILSNSFSSYTHHFTKTKYEFTDDEYKNIQDAINTLRSDIAQSDIFGEDHQERLLKKLEELQKELHQKMNRLDKALGQMSSIGVILGKFGKDAKPMFDRFNETFKLVHKAEERGDDVTPIGNQIGHEKTLEIELFEEESSDAGKV